MAEHDGSCHIRLFGCCFDATVEVAGLLSDGCDLNRAVNHGERGQHRIQMGVDQIPGFGHRFLALRSACSMQPQQAADYQIAASGNRLHGQQQSHEHVGGDMPVPQPSAATDQGLDRR